MTFRTIYRFVVVFAVVAATIGLCKMFADGVNDPRVPGEAIVSILGFFVSLMGGVAVLTKIYKRWTKKKEDNNETEQSNS